ncbi:MAG TPA: hypothetical protein VKW77_10215 [Acidimicrobiales bacterium]|nr:hypothetical protein [Acidimicrobiales bacterium]
MTVGGPARGAEQGRGAGREPSGGERLGEKLLDLLVFVPTGIAVSVAEELPKLAARGRERLGVPVSSARAVGEFAVRAGEKQLRRLSGQPPPMRPRRPVPTSHAAGRPVPPAAGVVPEEERVGSAVPVPQSGAGSGAVSGPAGGPRSPRSEREATTGTARGPRVAPRPGDGNVPPVSALAIPGFDTLSASQVVQRLDGLSREQLVSVRAYETSTRGRRTILNRVDQLLEERA